VKRTVHDASSREVESLQVGEEWLHGWQEAVEIAVLPPARPIGDLVRGRRDQPFDFEARGDRSPVRGADGQVMGLVIRQSPAICGMVEASAQCLEGNLYRVTFRVRNLTLLADTAEESRDQALLHSLVSAHLILRVRGGDFVSLLDPPEALKRHAAECRNLGVWPVLVGNGTEKSTLLASPIILYDYPQVAAEIPGDFFDSTEIDEMLVLRIQTLTPTEKRMMAAVDERARALLERTRALGPDDFLSLHGTMRDGGGEGKE
jgi:hydrogenase maturation protease